MPSCSSQKTRISPSVPSVHSEQARRERTHVSEQWTWDDARVRRTAPVCGTEASTASLLGVGLLGTLSSLKAGAPSKSREASASTNLYKPNHNYSGTPHRHTHAHSRPHTHPHALALVLWLRRRVSLNLRKGCCARTQQVSNFASFVLPPGLTIIGTSCFSWLTDIDSPNLKGLAYR